MSLLTSAPTMGFEVHRMCSSFNETQHLFDGVFEADKNGAADDAVADIEVFEMRHVMELLHVFAI